MTELDPVWKRMEREWLAKEMAEIEVQILNFVYWHDRWPEKILFFDGVVGPPEMPDSAERKWIRVGRGSRYICLE